MSSFYHPQIYDTSKPVESWWEASVDKNPLSSKPVSSDETCDVAVIGGGYTGLSTGYHLARDWNVDVRVLEAGHVGWGASGRNGGFCCMGSTKKSYSALTRQFGEAATRDFVRTQIASVDTVAALLKDEEMQVDRSDDGEYCVAHKPSRWKALEADHQEIARFGVQTRVLSKAEFAEHGFTGEEAHGALFIPIGFGVHPLKYLRSLASAALRRGVVVHPHSAVQAWTKQHGFHLLSTAGGTVRARRVVVATNGFTSEKLKPSYAGRVLPALTNIIVTRPLSVAEREAHGFRTTTPIYDSRNLLFYFRLLPDGRFLFGSRGGLSADSAAASRMRHWMHKRLIEKFPYWRDVEITHFWRGLIGMSRDLVPHVGTNAEDDSVFHALTYHGNGLAMATESGRMVAAEVAGRRNDRTQTGVPVVMSQPLKPFPFPGLRLTYLRAAYAGYRFMDEVL